MRVTLSPTLTPTALWTILLTAWGLLVENLWTRVRDLWTIKLLGKVCRKPLRHNESRA